MDTGIVILPQKVLDEQICSGCCNYLSVGPVTVCSGGLYNKMCGRCTDNGDIENACLSLYDKFAENCIFKCINHYSGCKELLAYNEAVDHEKNCKKVDLKCLYCEFEGNGCQLVLHCKGIHANYTAENNIFPILLEPGLFDFICAENDDLLCMKISISDNYINISNLLMAYGDDNSDLKCFKLIFFNPNSSVHYVTPEVQMNGNRDIYDQQSNSFALAKGPVINCFPSGKCLVEVKFLRIDGESAFEQMRYLQRAVKVSTTLFRQNSTNLMLMYNRILNMNVEFSKFVHIKRLTSVVCENCGGSVNVNWDYSTVYYCHKHHLVCKTCSTKKCPKCSVSSLWNKARLDRLFLKCDWGSCDKNVNIFDFLSHKQSCPHRQYRCPDHNCRYAACLDDFKKHWHLTPYQDSLRICINASCSFMSFYWLVSCANEFVHVTVEKSPKIIIVSVNLEQAIIPNAFVIKLVCYICSRKCSHLQQQKYEFSQLDLVGTLSAPIPTDYTSDFYLTR